MPWHDEAPWAEKHRKLNDQRKAESAAKRPVKKSKRKRSEKSKQLPNNGIPF